MKKLIFIILAFIAISTISCTEDFTNPKVLSGTTWRCSSISLSLSRFEYFEFKFISTSEVEAWQKEKDDTDAYKSDITGTYTIKDKAITIYGEDSLALKGTIENKTMTLISFGDTLRFTKQ